MDTCSESLTSLFGRSGLIWYRYVNESVASQNGYVTSTSTTVKISVDTTNIWPNGGLGRPAVRLISDNTYTHGLFILDLVHMPWGCGTWPAYWLLGPDWPYNGEIDIIEGVNTIDANSLTMHTSPGCTIAGSGQTATFDYADCSTADGNGCGSSFNNTLTPNNYGELLNSNGGGVYATEWTSDYVQTWFFPRGAIPQSITDGAPDVTTFGTPAVNAQGADGCTIDQHFNNMSIIINTDFCGSWAGEVYESEYPNCPANNTDTRFSGDTSLNSCVDFVGNNPASFVDAYWEIGSIKVYQMPSGAQPTSSYTTSLSSVTPTSGATSSLGPGMGTSTSGLSTAPPYTGPLSSTSTTTSALSPSGTPAICPSQNNTVWTDANAQQYTIACGSDYQGSSTTQQAASFENCMEICDGTSGCSAVSFTGGSGAGFCYLKDTISSDLAYVGNTDAAVRVAGAVPG